MDLNEKNKWRLRFKIYSMILVTAVLVVGIWLAVIDKAAAFIGIATNIIVFATGVFGIDYFTKPGEERKDKDVPVRREEQREVRDMPPRFTEDSK